MDSNQIKADFQIAGNRIAKFNLKNDFVSLDMKNELKSKTDVSYEINSIEKCDDFLVGIITLIIKSELVAKNKNKISVNLNIEGCFLGNSIFNEEKFAEILGVNGCAALYSIARSFIISTTSQSLSGGQIILPMINTFKLVESNTKQKKSTK